MTPNQMMIKNKSALSQITIQLLTSLSQKTIAYNSKMMLTN